MQRMPSQREIEELEAFDEPYCVSVYAPNIDTDTVEAANPNRIELKNILRQAEIALQAAGAGHKHTEHTLRPGRELLENLEFMPIRQEGMALFMHPKIFRYYYIPDGRLPSMLTVERGFNLSPLQAILADSKPYFLLALSHKRIRFYRGDRFRLEPVELKGFPADMISTLGIDEFPNETQAHPVGLGSSRAGKGSRWFHGQYNENETDKIMLLQFFRRVDKRLRPVLRQRGEPLVLAGVEYLLPIYREANTYPGLLTGSIGGNQEHSDLDRLRRQAWQLVSST